MKFTKLVNQILEQQLVTVNANDAATLGKTLGDPDMGLLNIPVDFRTELADGSGTSYGSGVTLDSIVRRAQNSLRVMGGNAQDKQSILTQAANSLQDWAIGLNRDNTVPQEHRIDDSFRDKLMDMASNLNNVEKFIGAIKLPNQPVQPMPIPRHGPALTQMQKDALQFRAVGDPEQEADRTLAALKYQQAAKSSSSLPQEKQIEDYATAYYDPSSSLYKKLRDPKFLQILRNQDPVYYNHLIAKLIEKRDEKHLLTAWKLRMRDQNKPEEFITNVLNQVKKK